MNTEKYRKTKKSQIQYKDQFRAFLPLNRTVPSQSILKSIDKDGVAKHN